MLLERDPVVFPADWAVAWGEDAYGLWQDFEIGGVRQVMRWIPPGRFQMGSPEGERERESDETLHLVTLSQGYWLAETACTQALWQAVTGDNPSRFNEGPDNPVERVSWGDCAVFIQQANQWLDGGLVLRLPTEAEWEYACRAGTQTPFSFGFELDTDSANYNGNYPYADGAKGEYRQGTLPVHHLRPNPWGLYQMHGNVWEWCEDGFDDHPTGPVLDPVGPPQARQRVLRGGAWFYYGRSVRSACRFLSTPDSRFAYTGLRLAGGFDPQAGR